MLGLPSKEELRSMSESMPRDTIAMVHRLDDIPRKDFRTILPKDLSVSPPFDRAADGQGPVRGPAGEDAEVEPARKGVVRSGAEACVLQAPPLNVKQSLLVYCKASITHLNFHFSWIF